MPSGEVQGRGVATGVDSSACAVALQREPRPQPWSRIIPPWRRVIAGWVDFCLPELRHLDRALQEGPCRGPSGFGVGKAAGETGRSTPPVPGETSTQVSDL